jgi:DNA-binding NarL/FixJ family response regulator
MRKLRILLADDHPGLLAAVRNLLKTDMDVIACVDNGECLFEAAMKLRPDVIVTDISMPKLSGIQVANRLRESGCSSRIVFLTVHTDPDVIRAALGTGALGYVVKVSLTTDLLFAIREAFHGRPFVSLETSAE